MPTLFYVNKPLMLRKSIDKTQKIYYNEIVIFTRKEKERLTRFR